MLFEKREVPRMKSITEAIYDGWINERERRNKLPQDDPECIALSKFEDTLTKEQKGLFDQSWMPIRPMRRNFEKRHTDVV